MANNTIKDDWQDVPLNNQVDDWQDITDESNSEEWKSKASDIPSLDELKAGLAGAAESFTFGAAPEIAGGVQALASSTFGDNKYSDLLETYKKYEAEREKDFRDLEKESPSAYLTGEIAGGVGQAALSGIATGGLSTAASLAQGGAKLPMLMNAAKLAGIGAGTGALTGAGYSKESVIDALSGDSDAQAGLAKDIGIGAGLGAAGNVVAPIIGKGLGKGAEIVGKGAGKLANFGGKVVGETADAARNIPGLEKLMKTYNLTKSGNSIVGGKAAELIGEESEAIAKKLTEGFSKQGKSASTRVGNVLKSVKVEQGDIPMFLTDMEQRLTQGKVLPDDLAKLTNVIDQLKTTTTKETVTKGEDLAIKKLELLKLKMQHQANALGEEVSFSPVENIDNKFLQSIKTQKAGEEIIDSTKSIQEGTGLSKGKEIMSQKIAKQKAEAAQLGQQITVTDPIFDKESNSLISTVTSKDASGNEVAKTISQNIPKDSSINVPTFADKNVANIMQVDIPEDLITKEVSENIRPDLNLEDIYNVRRSMGNIAGKLEGEVGSKQAMGAKLYADEFVNERLSKEAAEELASAKQLYGNTKRAANMIPGLQNETKLGQDSYIKVKEALDSSAKNKAFNLKKALELGQEEFIPQTLKDDATNIALRNQLNKESGKMALTGIAPSVNAAGIIGAAALGKGTNVINKVVKKLPREFTRGILNTSEDGLYKMASKLPTEFSESMIKALQDTTKKDRLLWALAQQPAFREAVNKIEEDEINNMSETLGQ